MHISKGSQKKRGEQSRRIASYVGAAGGMAGALASFESAQGALVIASPGAATSDGLLEFDLDGDTVNDIGVLVFSASLITAHGLVAGASIAGAEGVGGFFYPTALQPGDSVGPALNFDGNLSAATHTFGTLSNGTGGGGPGVGEWMGGGDAYLGAKFQVGPDTHYGWVHVVWDPGSSTATVDQIAYESTPNAAASVVPEPSTVFLLALGAVGLARRRRTE